MRDLMHILGRRLVNDREMYAFHRFPGSDEMTVIPPGQPSGLISSYITRGTEGFFQIEAKNGIPNLYILDSKNIEVVDPDTPDSSSFFDRVQAALGGFKFNSEREIDNQTGHLEKGVKQTFDEIKGGAFDLVKGIQQFALVVITLLVIILVSKFF